jgi:hypothetical protein
MFYESVSFSLTCSDRRETKALSITMGVECCPDPSKLFWTRAGRVLNLFTF